MSFYQDHRSYFTGILDLLEAHFGPDVELVLHDLTLSYEHTIVDIRNGHVTGRAVGDTGDVLGLQVLSGSVPPGTSSYNLINFTLDGRTLRSSTQFFCDEAGKPVLCLGINEDISRSLELERYLHGQNRLSDHPESSSALGRGDVNQMMDSLLEQAQLEVGKNTQVMTKEEKLQFLRYLDRHGAFLISKSGPRVCELLGISKFTLYNYLDAVRSQNDDPAQA